MSPRAPRGHTATMAAAASASAPAPAAALLRRVLCIAEQEQVPWFISTPAQLFKESSRATPTVCVFMAFRFDNGEEGVRGERVRVARYVWRQARQGGSTWAWRLVMPPALAAGGTPFPHTLKCSRVNNQYQVVAAGGADSVCVVDEIVGQAGDTDTEIGEDYDLQRERIMGIRPFDAENVRAVGDAARSFHDAVGPKFVRVSGVRRCRASPEGHALNGEWREFDAVYLVRENVTGSAAGAVAQTTYTGTLVRDMRRYFRGVWGRDAPAALTFTIGDPARTLTVAAMDTAAFRFSGVALDETAWFWRALQDVGGDLTPAVPRVGDATPSPAPRWTAAEACFVLSGGDILNGRFIVVRDDDDRTDRTWLLYDFDVGFAPGGMWRLRAPRGTERWPTCWLAKDGGDTEEPATLVRWDVSSGVDESEPTTTTTTTTTPGAGDEDMWGVAERYYRGTDGRENAYTLEQDAVRAAFQRLRAWMSLAPADPDEMDFEVAAKTAAIPPHMAGFLVCGQSWLWRSLLRAETFVAPAMYVEAYRGTVGVGTDVWANRNPLAFLAMPSSGVEDESEDESEASEDEDGSEDEDESEVGEDGPVAEASSIILEPDNALLRSGRPAAARGTVDFPHVRMLCVDSNGSPAPAGAPGPVPALAVSSFWSVVQRLRYLGGNGEPIRDDAAAAAQALAAMQMVPGLWLRGGEDGQRLASRTALATEYHITVDRDRNSGESLSWRVADGNDRSMTRLVGAPMLLLVHALVPRREDAISATAVTAATWGATTRFVKEVNAAAPRPRAAGRGRGGPSSSSSPARGGGGGGAAAPSSGSGARGTPLPPPSSSGRDAKGDDAATEPEEEEEEWFGGPSSSSNPQFFQPRPPLQRPVARWMLTAAPAPASAPASAAQAPAVGQLARPWAADSWHPSDTWRRPDGASSPRAEEVEYVDEEEDDPSKRWRAGSQAAVARVAAAMGAMVLR